MAHQEKIIVTIENDGTTTYKVEGVEGKACESEDYTFLDNLGKPGKRKHTEEYHRQGPNKGKLYVRR